MVQLSPEVHIKAVCAAAKQRVGFTISKTKKIHHIHFLLATTAKGLRLPTTVHKSSAHTLV